MKTLWQPAFEAGPEAALSRLRRPSIVHVEDRYMVCDGHSQPVYYEPADEKFYVVGGVPMAAPTSVTEVSPGGGNLPNGTYDYYMTAYNSRFGVETPVVAFQGTVAAGPSSLQITYTDPTDPQYDGVRIWRKITGGTYKLNGDLPLGSSPYTDNTADSGLLLADQIIRRRRFTLPPRFKGWVFHRGVIWAWDGKGAYLDLSQPRRVDVVTKNRNVLTDFPDDRRFYVEPNDGHGRITAVAVADQQLVVFKERAIYKVSGGFDPLDMEVDLVTAGRGCIAQHSLTTINSILFFLDERGPMMLPPQGQPLFFGALEGSNGSPLEDLWERINRRALHLVHAVVDKQEGTYEIALPLDFDPYITETVPLDWRSTYDRYMGRDSRTFSAAAAVFDGAGVRHMLALDELGTLWELNFGETGGTSPTAATSGATLAGSTPFAILTDGTWDAAEDMRGVPFEIRVANARQSDAPTQSNRVYAADSGTGTISPLYWFPDAIATGVPVVVGVIRARAQGALVHLNDPRYDKELRAVHVLFTPGVAGAELDCLTGSNHQAAAFAATIAIDFEEGFQFVDAGGINGKRVAWVLENADPDHPWTVTSVGLDMKPHGEK